MRTWCLVALSVALMIADHRYHKLALLRDYLSLIAYPVHWVIDAPTRLMAVGQKYVDTAQDLQAENERLKHEQLLQNARLQKLLALEAENARLRALLQSSPALNETLLMAEIIQANTDPFVHRVVVNKGAEHGVTVGQPVIDANGVVGEVIEVHPWVSRVILLTDVSYGIPVENVRSGVRGIIAGTGAMKSLQLQHVANTVDLAVGDALVTSGLDGRYPPGYPVGTVSRIDYDPGESFARVQVTPSAQLDRTRLVLLVQRQKDKP